MMDYIANATGTSLSWWSAGGANLTQILEYANARLIVWAESKVNQ